MTTNQQSQRSQEPIVVKSVEISTTPDLVWRALTEPDKISQWMDGAQVESTWKIGSNITFTGTMPNFNKRYKDRGTVIASERDKLLQYTHWSEMSRVPDLPQNRTLITFHLEWTGKQTLLTVRQENFGSETAYKHANFFWNVALHVLKTCWNNRDRISHGDEPEIIR